MWAIRKNDLKCMLLEFQKERKGKKKMETHIAVQNGILQAKASGGIIAGTSFSKKCLFLDLCD